MFGPRFKPAGVLLTMAFLALFLIPGAVLAKKPVKPPPQPPPTVDTGVIYLQYPVDWVFTVATMAPSGADNRGVGRESGRRNSRR